jgi:hypothetical protein
VGVLDKLEGGIEDAFDKAGARVFKGAIEPAQIARRAEKQMKREKLVGTGKQYAPTLYTVMVSSKDNSRMFNFYPTIATEVETYLMSRGADAGLSFDGRPLVRFFEDKKLKSGRFDVIAENVASSIVAELREEEAVYLGLKPNNVDKIAESEPEVDSAGEALPAEAESAYGQDAPNSGLREALRLAHGNSQPVAETVSSIEAAVETVVSEPASGNACLVDRIVGKSYDLTLTRMTIGRDDSCDIVLDDANASRAHASIRQNALGTWKVVDLESTNGTLVNDRMVEQMVLRTGDLLTIGVTVLEFVASAESSNPATSSALSESSSTQAAESASPYAAEAAERAPIRAANVGEGIPTSAVAAAEAAKERLESAKRDKAAPKPEPDSTARGKHSIPD